jgi:hypothetical protein
MFHAFGLFGLGFAGLATVSALAAIAYPVFVVWMIVDGFLRSDAEYPGTDSNRKVLWVVLMVLLHPVTIAYFIMVFLKVPRGSLGAPDFSPVPPAA